MEKAGEQLVLSQRDCEGSLRQMEVFNKQMVRRQVNQGSYLASHHDGVV